MRALLTLMLALAGCKKDETEANPPVIEGPDPYEAAAAAFWDPERVVVIEIEMATTDLEALASEQNDLFTLLNGADCLDEPWSGPYNWYSADVVVDGTRYDNVGIRKKGLLGSLSSTKPALKIEFDRFVDDQQMDGIERVTLNNSISDPSMLNQCLGYKLFADAGIAAPRCNFAHVTVNGADLGVYVSVEPYKKDFLRWAYDGDNDGDLYEGTLADFRDGWTQAFDPKTGDTDEGLGPILEATDALEIADDGQMFAALDEVVDLENFYTFWALEVLVGHVDGFAGNVNNYYVYVPEETDKLEFLPWGIDVIFTELDLFGSSTVDVAMANGQMTRRVWQTSEGQADYLQAMDVLLRDVWDEGVMLAEIDRMAELIEPYALPDPGRESAQDLLRSFVQTRRATMETLMAGPVPSFEEPLRDGLCLVEAGTLRMDFDTTWGTLEVADPLSEGSVRVNGTFEGVPFDYYGGSIAGYDGGYGAVAGVVLTSGTTAQYILGQVPESRFGVGTLPIDGTQGQGFVAEIDFLVSEDAVILASMWDAELVVETWTGNDGSPVTGYLQGTLYSGGPF